MAPPRPTVLGYVQRRPDAPSLAASGATAHLEAFARSRGWALGEVFVDDDPGRPLMAWASLLVTARERRPAAVVVPDLDGLSPDPPALVALRARLARDVGVPLVLTESPATP